MINEKEKEKLIKELIKEGNIFVACAKVGINRTTPYQWEKKNKKFKKQFREAIRIGRANTCDIAEHTLMINVKKGKMEAIKYQLSHNSPRYKPKRTNVVIEHKKISDVSPVEPLSYEDLVTEYKENGYKRALALQEYLTSDGKEIPNKPDGTPIGTEELYQYKAYILNWQECREGEKSIKTKIVLNSTDTANSRSLEDNPSINPPENHKTSDISRSDSSSHHNPPDSNK